MSDYPEIEKMPLEIDGIPVRETIREIFSNPENGTPDNISKAGCLALALKSNEAGGRDKGYVVWNAWRSVFPVKGWPRNNRNVADFQNSNLLTTKIDLSSFIFGDSARFQGSKWGDGINFTAAQWGNHANFKDAQWGGEACFQGAQWGDAADFQSAQWGNLADFRGSRWGRRANFKCASWNGLATFQGAQWDIGAEFNFAQWLREADFRGAQWVGGANFMGTLWGEGAIFQGDQWATLRDFFLTEDRWRFAMQWATDQGVSPDSFGSMFFSGAKFEGKVDFSNRKFTKTTLFGLLPSSVVRKKAQRNVIGTSAEDEKKTVVFEDDPDQRRHCIFAHAPVFHGCELHQDSSFEHAQFPDASGSEEAARAYRTLKLAFSKHQAIREEQRFFKLEMEEETLRETGIKRWLFRAYKIFSDYGFGVTRPLLYGGVAVVALSLVYGLLSWLGQCGFSVDACRFAPQWLEFSLLQTLPLPGLDKLSEAARKAFWPEGAWWGLGLSALVILHKTISLAALFLTGLALRNLFKLK